MKNVEYCSNNEKSRRKCQRIQETVKSFLELEK